MGKKGSKPQINIRKTEGKKLYCIRCELYEITEWPSVVGQYIFVRGSYMT